MTQEYTPVAWQDETTSQQGTLINAERLNQMQTAHHYADGLEEVDAIPTADPGVSYHKIVYCTADSTIYRWDGTEWTKDIDDETKALLQQEIARATEAEGELAQDLADEATARETADTAMQADISDLGDAIEAEETARGQADTALGTRITNETSARETADTALGNRITAEATARAEADTALGGRIDTEQARAEAAEQANAQAIANTYTKAEIDTALGAKADVATTYTKAEIDTALGAKADVATTYTKAEIDTALALKVTKLTTSGESAYTHNGTTQGERAISYDVVAGSIPRRDASGYLQANTNTTGTKSNILATGTRVQNDLDNYAPMVRTTGNQTKAGIMTFLDPIYGRLVEPLYEEYSGNLPSGKYRIFARISASNTNTMIVLDAMASANGKNFGYGRMIIGNPTTVSWFCKWVIRKSGGFLSATSIQIAREVATGDLVILALNPTYTGLSINLVYSKAGSSIHGAVRVSKVTGSADYTLDGTDTALDNIVPGSDMA